MMLQKSATFVVMKGESGNFSADLQNNKINYNMLQNEKIRCKIKSVFN